MLHLSDFKKMERCPKLFWLSRREKKGFISYINYNENMSQLVISLLMLKDPFVGKVNDDGALAIDAFHKGKVLVNARFTYRDLRIKVDVLLQEDGVCKLYVCYKSCYPKERESQHIADTLSVLKKLDIEVDEVYAIYLNASYKRGDTLDVHSLLLIGEYLFNSKNKTQTKIKQLIKGKAHDIDEMIDRLHDCLLQDEMESVRTSMCTRGSKCAYYEDCFFEDVQDSSILHLVQSAHKFDMLQEGIEQLSEVDVNRVEGTRHQYAQIMASRMGGTYVDEGALRCWIKDHIVYPISYLDFEWETFAFPPYKGMKPYDVLAFQYSLHVEGEKGSELTHVDFIGEKDCREAFIQSLLASVPKQGCILVYNMEGAEKLRLIQLAQQFPQYELQLKQIWERMVDLSLPFSTGNVYDIRMHGSYSLKTLVPVFSNYDYSDLDVSFGMDAVDKWRAYSKAEDKAEKDEIYHQLCEYCSLDSYAEYIVFHALEELVSK